VKLHQQGRYLDQSVVAWFSWDLHWHYFSWKVLTLLMILSRPADTKNI